MPWEHPNGYFPAAFSPCKADLHQLAERVGVPRGLSTGLGSCWPRGEEKGWGPRGLQVPVHSGDGCRDAQEGQGRGGVQFEESEW